jgi:hypothetical protein
MRYVALLYNLFSFFFSFNLLIINYNYVQLTYYCKKISILLMYDY